MPRRCHPQACAHHQQWGKGERKEVAVAGGLWFCPSRPRERHKQVYNPTSFL
jgi:hypothetical protein